MYSYISNACAFTNTHLPYWRIGDTNWMTRPSCSYWDFWWVSNKGELFPPQNPASRAQAADRSEWDSVPRLRWTIQLTLATRRADLPRTRYPEALLCFVNEINSLHCSIKCTAHQRAGLGLWKIPLVAGYQELAITHQEWRAFWLGAHIHTTWFYLAQWRHFLRSWQVNSKSYPYGHVH